MSSEMTEFEKEIYDFIRKHGEMLTSDIPTRLSGAIPNMKNKGVIEIFRRQTSRWAPKKRKFVRIRSFKSDSKEGSMA